MSNRSFAYYIQFKLKKNTFTQQGCIKEIEIDNRVIYNVSKDFFFQMYHLSKNHKNKYIMVSQKI